MNKKILIIIGILALCIILAVGLMKFWEKPEFGTCKTDKDCKNVRCVGAFCDNGKCICPTGGTGDLSRVKVASLYEWVTDNKIFNPLYEDVTNGEISDIHQTLKETNTDFIFRGFWRWDPCPDSFEMTLPNQYPQDYVETCVEWGYTYQQLREAITKIKKDSPKTIFVGSIPAQRVTRLGWNPITGEYFKTDETWEMALDPSKWEIDMSKKEFQCKFAKTHFWVDSSMDCKDYDPEQVSAYFPDITNEKFQELLLSWAQKQIDSGADAIWIDMLFTQAELLTMITKDPNHPAVEESYMSASKIVDEIHSYGYSRGKYIYVGSWPGCAYYSYYQPNLDFVTASPSGREILTKELNEVEWDERIRVIREKLGDIPIFAFIDWAGDIKTPLGAFSQNLTSEEQKEFLKTADDFFMEKGVVFTYPVHGGNMGLDAEILSFNKSKVYDSLAPEFQTYETIKELALAKKPWACTNDEDCKNVRCVGAYCDNGECVCPPGGIRTESICTDGIDNDADGLVDNEDGDCWIREGAVFMEDFIPVRSFEDIEKMLPELREIGINTLELLPVWKSCSSGNPWVRWAISDYYVIDPERGGEEKLQNLIEQAHNLELKIVPMIQTTGTFTPSQDVCKGRTIPVEKLFYDQDRNGGYFYQYQIANPDKEILLQNLDGDYACLPPGFGFAVNQDSEDTIELIEIIYKKQILSRGFDGARLDANGVNNCVDKEMIYFPCNKNICPDPVEKRHTPLPLYRRLTNLKSPDQVFLTEVFSSERIFSDDHCNYPYYSSYPDIDEVAEVSEGYEFIYLLGHIVTNELNSAELVDWVNEQQILYDRQRFRMIRNWNKIGLNSLKFVAINPGYYSAVTLASTIPGIPKVSDYELFGNKEWDEAYEIIPTNFPDERREHWKKILNIRNNNNALKYGSMENVWKSGDNTYAYVREYEDEKVIVVINFLDKETASTLDLSFLDKGTILYDGLNDAEFGVTDPGNFEISVPMYGSRILVITEKPEVRAETICTDGIDNDGDGLIDNEDGDCWIREGAVLVENYYMTTFNDYLEILPELQEVGIKTLEMMAIWEHCTSDSTAQRWAVRDFSKLDPMRGNEKELRTFIDTAHNNEIKVLTMMTETGSAVPPYPADCGGYNDKDGVGGALYLYQIKNPDKNILIRDKNGKFICGIGAQYAVNWSSEDVVEFFKNVYKQMQNYGFDGQRLDAPCELSCKEREGIYQWMCGWGIACSSCEGKLCPYPVDTAYSPMDYYRELAKIKKQDEVFIGETPSVKSAKSNWFCYPPYYPIDVMVDEIAEVSESASFPYLMPSIINSEISSSEFINWLKNEPISHNRQRFRFISTWTRTTKPIANFIVNNPGYPPLVTLVSTMPGIPKMTHYELYGNEMVDVHHQIQGDSVATAPKRRELWKKVLKIRNNNNALKYSTIENVWRSGDNTYAYVREYEDEKVLVVINFLDREATSYLDLSFLNKGTVLYDELNDEEFTVSDPENFQISVPAYGSRILTVK